jgi:glutamate 5-kinase
MKMKRIVIKIGTKVLTAGANKLDPEAIRDITEQVSVLMGRGIEVIIVSSGAVGSGLGILKIAKKPKVLSQLQAISSIGQSHLMQVYNEFFSKKGYVAGQMLLTQEDFNSRKRFLNIKHTLNNMLKYGAVPVINENDAISTQEIKCGDNDRLSSLVADIAGADALIILTDVDGLYDERGKVIAEVPKIDDDILALCKGKGSEVSTGGMQSKLHAVKYASAAGIRCFIVKGRRKDNILDVVEGKDIGTCFSASERSLRARKRWIAFGKRAKGKIIVDPGAAKAMTDNNKSLLATGVTGVEGRFHEGDVVDVVDQLHRVIAKGLVNYAWDEVDKIKRCRSDMIEKQLGYKSYDEVIHKDNLVIVLPNVREKGEI